MSVKRLVPLNLPALNALPASAHKGDLVYLNSDDLVHVYDGTAWKIASGGGSGVGGEGNVGDVTTADFVASFEGALF